MTKALLTGVVQRTFPMTEHKASSIVDALLGAITESLVMQGKYSLPSFGTFRVASRPKRAALNPRTLERITVAASQTVRFRASPVLKEIVTPKQKKRKLVVKAEIPPKTRQKAGARS